MHYIRVMKHGDPTTVLAAGRHFQDLALRFWAKVDKSGDCWIWTASRNQKGYGKIAIGSHPRSAHRVVYEMERGPIPVGLEIDHLCRNRACVRPSHLELVTHLENWRRGMAPGRVSMVTNVCRNGHSYSGGNTLMTTTQRYCRICWNKRRRAYRARLSQRLGRAPRNGYKTECIRGHPFDETNTRIMPNGHRQCRTCNAIRMRARVRPSRARVQIAP